MRGQGRIYQRSGTPFYWCAYYRNGKQVRETTGETDEKKARRFLKRKIDQVITERNGGPAFIGPKQRKIKVTELLDALDADYKLRGKDSPQFQSHLKAVRGHFGDWPSISVTPEAIDKFIEARQADNYARATINRSTQLLSQAFHLAVRRGHLSKAPEVRHLSETGNVRQGFFSDREFQNVESGLPKYLKDFARFGYLTGWRKSEIASLRWEDVDGDAIRLRGENAKNGEGRSVSIDGELAELIDRRRKARAVKTKSGVVLADLLFHHGGHAIVDIRKAWATATKLAGCKGKLFHDLRRTAVRNMVNAGVPEKVAMTISGHKTRSMFDRYSIVSSADVRNALQRTQEYRMAVAEAEAKRQPAEMMQ